MPKIKGVPFETAIIERYKRRETSLEEALIEMYLAGVSVHRYIGLFTTRISKEKLPPVRQQLFLQVPIAIPMHRAVLFSINNGFLPVIRDLFYSGIAFKIHIPACTVLCVSIIWPAACFTPQPPGTGSMSGRIYKAYPFKPCARFLSIFAGR